MSDTHINLHASERETQDVNVNNIIQEENIAQIAIEREKQINVTQNESPCSRTEAIDMKLLNNNEIQEENCDKAAAEDAKTTYKKELYGSNVATYLKSDLFNRDIQNINVIDKNMSVRLPEYTEIDVTDVMGNSRKVNKDNKRLNFSLKNKKNPDMKQAVTVQFMGSETLPENKELFEYDTEDTNKPIIKMFIVLTVMHFTTALAIVGILLLVGLGKATKAFTVILLPVVALALFVACFHKLRTTYHIHGVIVGTVVLWAMLGVGVTCIIGAVGLYLSLGYYFMSFVDLIGAILGWCNYNFKSRSLWAIFLCSYPLSIFVACLVLLGVAYLGVVINFTIPSTFHFPYTDENTCDRCRDCGMYIAFFYPVFLIIITTLQFRFLLNGEWIELGNDDHFFAGYLLYVAPLDFPIRMLRKFGAFDTCDPIRYDEEE